MKPYGWRPGDDGSCKFEWHCGQPRGRSRERKLHDERRMIHR